MFDKLLVLVTLVLLIPQLSAGGTCSSQDIADSVDQRIWGTLANITRNYAQINELLAPVSTFLQATLIKQVLVYAEYGINPTNTTCKSDPMRQLNQICEAILRVKLKNGHLLHKSTRPQADTTEAQLIVMATLHLLCYTHVRRSRPSIPTASQTTT